MIRWPNIGMFGDFEPCEAGVLAAINSNFLILDALVQMAVFDFVAELPLSPSEGDIYILTTDQSINIWDGSDWVNIPSRAGMISYVNTEGAFYWFDGTNWVSLGDVVSLGASTDNAITRFHGTSGKVIQNSGVILDDLNDISGVNNLFSQILNTDLFSINQELVTGLTGDNVTIPSPDFFHIKVQSNVDSIDDITNPTTGGYDRLHILKNDRTTGDLVLKNNSNIVTGTGSDLTIKNKASVFLVYDDSESKWYVVGGTGSGSGGGVVNLILNGNADDTSNSIFIPYQNFGDRPTDGTGGSPTVTTSMTSVAPLVGVKSFLLTKPVGDFQGEGWSVPFSVDLAYRAKSLKISVDYIVNSGTFEAGSSTTDSDVIWYIYDITNSQLIEPSNIKMFSNSSALSDKFEATFQTSATGSSYRLIAHIATGNGSAYELKVDNVTVTPQNYVYGTPVTDFSAYTPTFNGLGTPTNVSFFWKRVGDTLSIKGRFTTGTTTGVTTLFSLPPGLSLDSSKTSATLEAYGDYIRQVATASTRKRGKIIAYITDPNNLYMTVDDYTTAVSPGSGVAGNALFASGEVISVQIDNIPIQGWSSSTRMSDGYDARAVSFTGEGTGSTQAITANVTNIAATAIVDKATSWTGSTYVVKSAGDYWVSGFLYSAATSFMAQVYINSVPNKYLLYTVANLGGSGSVLIQNLKAGDIISIRSTSSMTLAGDAAQQISILKDQAPTTISASEVVAAHMTIISGTVLTINVAIPYTTKIYDTHGALTTGAGARFTAPRAGFATVRISQASNTSVNYQVFKNGSAYTASPYIVSSSAASVVTNGSKTIPVVAGDYLQIVPDAGTTTQIICDFEITLK